MTVGLFHESRDRGFKFALGIKLLDHAVGDISIPRDVPWPAGPKDFIFIITRYTSSVKQQRNKIIIIEISEAKNCPGCAENIRIFNCSCAVISVGLVNYNSAIVQFSQLLLGLGTY